MNSTVRILTHRVLPLAALSLATALSAQAQTTAALEPTPFSLDASIFSSSTPYTQNFDTLANGTSTTNTVIPTGWGFSETGTSPTLVNGAYGVTNGSTTTGDTYSFGTTGSTDRALGSLLSNGVAPTLFAAFTNTSGSTIGSLTISYTGEQWRLGLASRPTPDQLDFAYSLDASSTSTGNYTEVDQLDFVAPISAGTVGALDGNLAANRKAITFTISGLVIQQGQTFYFRFVDFNVANSDDGLGIDDFSMTATMGATPKVLVYNPPSSQFNTSASNTNFLDGTTAVSFGTGTIANVANFTNAGLTNGSTVTVDSAGVTTFGVNVSNTTGTYTFVGGGLLGTAGLTKSGAGTLILNNAGNAYTGATVISGGELRSGQSEVIPDGTVKVTTGGVLNINGFLETVNSLAVDGGSVKLAGGTLVAKAGISLTGATLGDDPSGFILLGTTVDVLASTNASTITGNIDTNSAAHTFNVANGAAAEDLIVNGNFLGSGRITITGSGTTRLNGDSSAFTGGVSLNNLATLVLGNAKALGTSSAPGVTPETGFFFLNGGSLSIATAMNISLTSFSLGGSTTISGADLTLSGGFRLNNTQAKTLTVLNNTTITSNILPGTGGTTGTTPVPSEDTIRKAGSGTLTLSGANTYVNGTSILEGTLVAANDTALGAGPASLAPATGLTSTLRLTTAAPVVTSLASSGAGTANVILGATGVNPTLQIGGSSTTPALYAGSFQQATGQTASLRKVGTNVQALNGTTTYSGSTVIEAGTLSIGGSLNGTSSVSVGSAGTAAILAGQGTTTVAGAGAFTVGTNGTLAPGDTVDPTGQMTVNATNVSLAGTLDITLGSTVNGGSVAAANAGLNDSLNVIGGLTLASTATLTGSLLNGFATTINDLFFVVLNDSTDAISGRFLGLAQGATVTFGAASFVISYTGDSASSQFSTATGNDIVLRSLTTVIPEPVTGVFLLTGLAALGLRRRRNPTSELQVA